VRIINNILRYQLRKNLIVYYSEANKSIYYFLDFNLFELTQIKVKRCHWFFNDEKFLKLGFDSLELVGYFPSLKLEKILTNSYILIENNIGVATDYTNSDGRTHKESLFSLPEEKQLLKEWLPDAIFHVQDQYWVNDTLTDFKLIDSNKGEILWTIPQPLVEKTDAYDGRTNIKKVLGIYKNGLWLQLPDRRLWKLDIQTGELLEEIENFYFSAIPEGIFLSQQGLIIIFHYTIYAEYNLETKEFTTDKEISSENELIIRNVLFNQNDNYLYFTGNKDKSFYPNVYGIFNRKTLTFDFIGGSINETSYFYQTPQVNHELFTILDSEGNLIIHKIKDLL